MFRQLGTPENLKREMALPETGDHVMGSPIKSKDVTSVLNETLRFGKEILQLPVGTIN
jgi:hypothetical protein